MRFGTDTIPSWTHISRALSALSPWVSGEAVDGAKRSLPEAHQAWKPNTTLLASEKRKSFTAGQSSRQEARVSCVSPWQGETGV